MPTQEKHQTNGIDPNVADESDRDEKLDDDDLTRARVLSFPQKDVGKSKRQPPATAPEVKALFARLDEADNAEKKEETTEMSLLTEQLGRLSMRGKGSTASSDASAIPSKITGEGNAKMRPSTSSLQVSEDAQDSDGSDSSWQKI